MRETIGTILSEWRERKLPHVIEREVSLDRYLSSEHVVVVKGFRRVGKTYLLYRQIKSLLARVS